MSAHPTTKICRVPSCRNDALYVCPRCGVPYCSVSCYRAHSQPCVDAFAQDAMNPLRGLTASPAHRRSFNAMLERMRHEPDAPYTEPQGFQQTDSGDESDDVCETSYVQTAEHTKTIVQPDRSGESHILEELLHSLDEAGRQALFTVLNSAMENTHGRAPISRPPPIETTSQRNEGSSAVSTGGETKDVTDTLDMLVEEMETMDLSYDEILSRLPDFLRIDFEKRLREGKVSQLMQVWIPWWQKAQGPSEENSEEEHEPAPLPYLPLANQLLVPLHIPRQKASFFLRYSLIDILAAYALSMRLCNGEWWGDAFAARSMWRISAVLSGDARYTSVDDACDAVKKSIVQEENHTLAMQVLRDIGDILSGRSDWVARAVYECQRVLEAGLKVSGCGKGEIRKRIRKVGFFVAWSMSQESEVFEQLSRKVVLYVELECGVAEEVKIAARAAESCRASKITVLD